MGTRTKRIFSNQIREQLMELDGKMVQIICWSGITRAGSVSVEEGSIILRDLNSRWYNRRQHRHHISVDEIREVLIDETSPW